MVDKSFVGMSDGHSAVRAVACKRFRNEKEFKVHHVINDDLCVE
jgi:hypothetical protein